MHNFLFIQLVIVFFLNHLRYPNVSLISAPNFKAFDFEHYKTLKQAESWRPKPEEGDGATKPPTESRTIYTDNRQIYGESIRYSDMAAKPASSEKYQPPHRRA